jgi:hypothetical protein
MTIDENTQEEQRLTHTTQIEAGTQNARDAAALAREAVAIEARLGAPDPLPYRPGGGVVHPGVGVGV